MTRQRAATTAGALLGSALLLAARPAADRPVPPGTVEVRVTDHRAGIADFAALPVRIDAIGLHPAGAPRREGWIELPAEPGVAPDLVPLKDGRSDRILTAPVAARRYDAVRVRFGAIRGTLKTGVGAAVTPDPATVAVDLHVAPERAAVVLIDLHLEDLSDHQDRGYVLKVRDVTVR